MFKSTSIEQINFHEVHGRNIHINTSQHLAERTESYCDGICFTNRPLLVGEKITICIFDALLSPEPLSSAERQHLWSGSLRIGVTTADPTTINPLPKYSIPDFANKSKFWMKTVPNEERHVANTCIDFRYDKAGVLMMEFGKIKEQFIKGINVRQPVWLIIDVYGNTKSVKLSSNCKGKKVSDVSYRPVTTTSIPSNHSGEPHHSDDNNNDDDTSGTVPGDVFPESYCMTVFQQARQMVPLLDSAGGCYVSSSAAGASPGANVSASVRFSAVSANVCVSPCGSMAHFQFANDSKCHGYCFLDLPIVVGQTIEFDVISAKWDYVGVLPKGLTFGLTPDSVKRDSTQKLVGLPGSIDDLELNYSVMVNEAVYGTSGNPSLGDRLKFVAFSDGPANFVQLVRNDTSKSVRIPIDLTSPTLKLFFQLNPTICGLRVLSATKLGPHSDARSSPGPSMRAQEPALMMFDEELIDLNAAPSRPVPPPPPPPPPPPLPVTTVPTNCVSNATPTNGAGSVDVVTGSETWRLDTRPADDIDWIVTKRQHDEFRSQFAALTFDAEAVDSGRRLLSGKAVREVFLKSGLPQTRLFAIWNLVDTNADGRVNEEEFAMALYLIQMSLKGYRLPETTRTLTIQDVLASIPSPGFEDSFTEQQTQASTPPPVATHPAIIPTDVLRKSFGSLGSLKRDTSRQPSSSGAFEVKSDCVVCIAEPSTVVIMPCFHVCLCESCAGRFSPAGEGGDGDVEGKKFDSTLCPICRVPIVKLNSLHFV